MPSSTQEIVSITEDDQTHSLAVEIIYSSWANVALLTMLLTLHNEREQYIMNLLEDRSVYTENGICITARRSSGSLSLCTWQ